jgi:glycosyltransferase involved in cell wall biosynthesis
MATIQERSSSPSGVTDPSRPRITVVIPCLNEAESIAQTVHAVRDALDQAGLDSEVLVVDNDSEDASAELAQQAGARVITERRRGYGSAYLAGFAAARGEYIVMIDADGSMDPGEIVRFVDALQTGCDFVKGSRFAEGGGTDDISRVRRLGNDALRTAVNLLYRTNFTDLCYGYIGFRRERLQALRLDSEGFEIETEMIARAVVASLNITEIGSFEAERRHGESNLHAWRDGRRALKTLLRERFILPKAPMAPVPSDAR